MNNTYKNNKTDWRRLGRSAILLAALLLGGLSAQAADYVFMYDDNGTWHFVGDNGNGTYVADATVFEASSCIWSGTSGSSFSNQSQNGYLYCNGASGWATYTSQNLTINNYRIYYSSSSWFGTTTYYLRYDNGWTSSTTNSQNQVVYTISGPQTASWTTPVSISGSQTTFTSIGSFTYTANAVYSPAYYTLTGASTYYVVEGGTPTGTLSDLTSCTYTWSLNNGTTDDGHVRINASTGEVEYYNSYATTTHTTIKVTASNANTNTTTSDTKELTFNAIEATSINADEPSVTAYVGEPLPIGYTLSPTGAYDHVAATSSSTDIFTVPAWGTNGSVTITPLATGSATLTLTAYKPNGTTVSPSATVTVNVRQRVAKPVITIADNGDVTITCATDGATIRYTTGDTEPAAPTSSTGTAGTSTTLTNLQYIKAKAFKDGYDDSEVASDQYVTTGTGGSLVVLDDRENHSWSYYSDPNCPIRSLNPADVKITYYGDGIMMTGTTDYTSGANTGWIREDDNNYVGNAKVNVGGEDENTFIYFKTLERGDATQTAWTYSTDHSSAASRCPYTTIPNPFQVRPTYGSAWNGTNTDSWTGWRGFQCWRLKSVTGGAVYNADGTALSVGAAINADTKIYFAPNSEYGMAVELEAVWAIAYVVKANGSGANAIQTKNVGYERNFIVLHSTSSSFNFGGTSGKRITNTNYPATVSTYYPDGTQGDNSGSSIRGEYDSYYRTYNLTLAANTKFENISFNMGSYTLTAANHSLTIGRGCSGTINYVSGINDDVTSPSYTLRLESGTINYLSFLRGYSTTTGTATDNGSTLGGTPNVKGVLGCDYDRATNSGITNNLIINNGAYYGYGVSENNTVYSEKSFVVHVKSGKIGNSFTINNSYTADAAQAFYIGIAGARVRGHRMLYMEGGEVASIAGGIDATQNQNNNSVTVRMTGGHVRGAVYGAAARSAAYGNRNMIVTGGSITGWFGGGCNGEAYPQGQTSEDTYGGITYGATKVYFGGTATCGGTGSNVTINGSQGGIVFGAGKGVEGNTTSGRMSQGTTVVVADECDIERNVYGGGNYGYAQTSTTVYVSGGTVHGSVFGGSNQNNGPAINIKMIGGLIEGGLYGGSNTTGTINNSVTMQIDGGQVGTPSQHANIHGGGYGASTRVSQNVEVTLGSSCTATSGVTVYGDVYGGSALGYVNGTTATTDYHTYVTLNKGTIHGSLYGGGLGAAGTAANVYGPVQVKVFGGSVLKTDANGANGSGAVYGCNNIYGAPQRSVAVDIYGTDPAPSANDYALFAVYGGGNQADYAYGTPTVKVHNCNNSIEYVYGGGNAAHITNGNTDVTIYGGNKIGNVFGGGNGTVTAANVSGDAVTKIYGGTILRVFGGSNSAGSIGGTISVTAESQTESGTNPCTGTAYSRCPIQVGELYGGGNEANSAVGSVSIGCMEDGDMIDYVYGGANQADVTGDINLEMTGGRVGNLFGGNNTSGTVSGGINVTVNWATGNEACSNNYLGNVFGGGNLAPYTIPGGKTLQVNIFNGTVSGNVFGGGKGDPGDHTKGQVTGNPQVTIGDNVNGHQVTVSGSVFGGGDAGNVSGTPVVNVAEKCNTTISTAVYGGGNAADVTGTNVTINGGTIGDVFGGGNGAVAAANVTGATSLTIHGGTISRVFAGGNTSGTIGTNSGVTIDHTSICAQAITEVYGGGNLADGNAGTVNISCSAENIGDVYGGANQADVANDITLNITGGQINNVFGGNNTSGSISGGITVNINKATDCNTFSVNNVYGGGNLAQYTIPNNKALAVNILNGTVSQNVYGGGKGLAGDHSKGQVTGNPTVTIGDLTSGHESYVATVTGDVYGGGDAGNVVGTPVVTVENKCNTSVGYVYGGGNAADVSGTNVRIYGGTIVHDVFGGGHGDKASLNVGLETGHSDKVANVDGNASVTITGGTIDRVFAGSNINGTINGTSNVLSINKSASAACAMKIREVYGGGNLAAGNATTISVGCTGSIVNGNNGHAAHPENIGTSLEGIGTVYGGANNANIGAEGAGNESDITLNINSGMVANVFGGNNNGGTIYGDITVNIEKTSDACGWYVGNVYGAGNLAPYTGSPAVNVKNGTVSQNVYGGGKGASAVVTGNPVVTIGDATVAYAAIVSGDVYGGGDAAAVTGNSSVTYNDANASSSVARLFGGGNAAGVSGTAGVTLTNGKVTGGVYGGCNASGSVGPVVLSLTGGTVGATGVGNEADVYGGGYGASTGTTGNIGVTLNGTTVYGDLYGGSALGSVNANTSNTTTVTLTSATLHGSVFGGGKGDGGTTATSEGQAIVNINVYDQYLTGIYGGANVRGLVKGDIAVNVNANVGADGNGLDIFGGGYGAATNTNGNVTVTIGNEAGTIVPTIYGDIYGGSALGNVNDAAADVTTVNFLNGTLHGNLYGGGLGDGSNAAKVNGQVVVNISNTTQTEGNCHIDLHEATIYGCNNTNGSPQDNVTVNIYKTAHTTTNAATYTENDGVNGVPTYAIDQVFGGGNQADYLPEDGAANSTKKTTVNVYGCTNTIRRLFSGGNAAAATGVAAEIEGGRFDWVFGGGNGEVTAANIGNGGTNLQVHGGVINNLFGGSNARGTITGQMNVAVDADGACGSDMYVAEFYCGNNLANVGTEDNHTNIVASVGCGAVFGDVYGGCKMANIFGNVTLTIYGGTINTVYGGSKGAAGTPANITGDVTLHIYGGDIGNVFGGSNINGNITGNIAVDVDWNHTGSCADTKQIDNVYGGSNLAEYEPNNTNAISPLVTLTNGCVGRSDFDETDPGAHGRVFGGGKGSTDNINAGKVTANPKVLMNPTAGGALGVYNGTTGFLVKNAIYGGGEVASVVGSTMVQIDKGHVGCAEKLLSHDNGFVFGGGMGYVGNYLLANVSANCTVTMSGGYVHNTLFGGGEMASVGTYTYADQTFVDNNPTFVLGEQNSCANGTGTTTVNISGGQIGPVNVTMDADLGYVFGAGQGYYTQPEALGFADPSLNSEAEGYNNARFGYVNNAVVNISENALIVGAVWGGSENGQVLNDCRVNISGGQIGVGDGKTGPYTDEQWTAAINAVKAGDASAITTAATAMPECKHWQYRTPYLPYDAYIDNDIDVQHTISEEDRDASTANPGDGHTFFGNVFGGGSGYYPYRVKHDDNKYYSHFYAFQGRVRGNTYVNITGGHILTSVYGGCEYADVLGNTNVTMSGGTLGVPRTVAQILAHPVTCYLFGGGKGDQRTSFNDHANVNNATVLINNNAFIFGSVFGGGEDGHVHENTSVTITGNAWVGNWGTSYYDGNIFGGGRGFGGTTLNAGSISGNAEVNIGGNCHILGNIYGGGRLASVGLHIAHEDQSYYGELLPDDGVDDPLTLDVDESKNHGHITINISGGTIGNSFEFTHPAFNPANHYYVGDVVYYQNEMWRFTHEHTGAWDHDDATDVVHTTGGNVFGSSMGRLLKIGKNDDQNPDNFNHLWPGLAKSRTTEINISGGNIYSNVYGGGELGYVMEHTKVSISGGTIGHVLGEGTMDACYFGSVFGGGYGSDNFVHHTNDSASVSGSVTAAMHAGRVYGNTEIEMTGGLVLGNIYGGGELASVGRRWINITSSEDDYTFIPYTGTEQITVDGFPVYPWNENIGNTKITISGGTVGDVTHTTVDTHRQSGWVAGKKGGVFGGGKGRPGYYDEVNDIDYGFEFTRMAYVDKTDVTISDNARIAAVVFGGGENGHVRYNTKVTMTGGLVGVPLHITEYAMDKYGYSPVPVYQGNIYGGGRGVDVTSGGHLGAASGQVFGNTAVTISGGQIYHNVYGGGSLATVGTMYDDGTMKVGTGRTDVTITGNAIIGDASAEGRNSGAVFGSGRGVAGADYASRAYVNNTYVTIGADDPGGKTCHIYGNVFGGGENGHVEGHTHVYIKPGCLIGELWYDVDAHDAPHEDFVGNVYGGGRGVDLATGQISRTAGWVRGSTHITITGGHIFHNVFGGGSLANVGDTLNLRGVYAQYYDTMTAANGDAYDYDLHKHAGYTAADFDAATANGHSYIFVSGGEIGADGDKNGCVFGGGRGTAGHSNYPFCISPLANPTAAGYDGPDNNSYTVNGVTSNYDFYTKNEGGKYTTYRVTNLSELGYQRNDVIWVLGKKRNNTSEPYQDSVTLRDYTNHTYVTGAHVMIAYPSIGVDSTTVTSAEINYADSLAQAASNTAGREMVNGSVYGGGDNGHVRGKTEVRIDQGRIGTLTGQYNGNVFGGGSGEGRSYDGEFSMNAGRVYGSTSVTINGGWILHNVYGGGNMAGVGDFDVSLDQDGNDQTIESTSKDDWLNGNGTVIGYTVHDGATSVTINGGHIGEKFFDIVQNEKVDGKWVVRSGMDSRSANHGGNVFGSSRGQSLSNELVRKMAWVNLATVTVNNTNTPAIMGSVFGGGENGHVFYTATVNINGGTIGVPNQAATGDIFRGNVYGGGRGIDPVDGGTNFSRTSGLILGNTYVNMTSGTVYRNVFGGGSMATVGTYSYVDNNTSLQRIETVQGEEVVVNKDSIIDLQRPETGKTEVHISGGTVGINGINNGRVFGAGRGVAGLQGETMLDEHTYVDRTYVTISANADIKGGVFGSGDNGHVFHNTQVVISGGTIGVGNGPEEGNVFGSGRGADTYQNNGVPTFSPNAGRVHGNTEVYLVGGTIKNDVYGGGFLATVNGNTHITVNTTANVMQEVWNYTGAIPTLDNNASHIDVTSTDATPHAPIVYGDIFGGSALGELGTAGNTTVLDILGGTIGSSDCYNSSYGNIFGGGNGSTGGLLSEMIPSGKRDANVLNTVTVNIGAIGQQGNNALGPKILGDVFGGNNVAGSPKGNVNVNVYSTQHTANTDDFAALLAMDPGDDTVADLQAVAALLESADPDDVIAGNALFALDAVYGGGNAADYVPADVANNTTTVTIFGCTENTIKYVYGGGKAASVNETHVIIHGGHIYRAFAGGDGSNGIDGANIGYRSDNSTTYGAGTTDMLIEGGAIFQAFGGSNTLGKIAGTTTVNLDQEGTCPLNIVETFGGNNLAESEGDREVTIHCGTKWNDVYGGNNMALHHNGNIKLNILGGQINRAFGGSRAANIEGNVEVNVFGGSIKAVYGGNNVSGNITGTITVNIDSNATNCSDPWDIDTVYGSGNEAAYTPTDPTATPMVNLIHGKVDVAVFGGGYGAGATVTANPQVTIGAWRKYHITGGGTTITPVVTPAAEDKNLYVRVGGAENPVGATLEGNVFGGGNAASVSGNTKVIIQGNNTMVWHNVYGGGNAAEVTGNTDVEIGKE